jgi:hypothetical protein
MSDGIIIVSLNTGNFIQTNFIMAILRSLNISLVLLIGTLYPLAAQGHSRENSKFEIGMDFVKFNRNWIYYNDFRYPVDISGYNFDLTPSYFFKIHLDYFSLRFGFEHIKCNYFFVANSPDLSEKIDGTFFNNRYLAGAEKYLIDNRIKFYLLVDLGLSGTRFDGTYSATRITPGIPVPESFKIRGLGLIVQPGFGVKYRLFKTSYLNLESSVYFEKGYDNGDNHSINPSAKFIPRPVSLFGFSTNF